MGQNSLEIGLHIYGQFTNVQWQFHGERIAFSTNSPDTTRYPYAKQ